MKTLLILTSAFLINVFNFTSGFSPKAAEIHYDGLYFAKTGELNIPNKKMDIYNYIRFYKDGGVYTQSVTAYDPEKISKWFNKDGRFERKGTYKLKDTSLNFEVTNNESPDKALEGAKKDSYTGKLTEDGKLQLEVKYASGTVKEFTFEFVKTN